MFKNLLSFWKARDFLQEVLDDFANMMEETHAMFKNVCDLLLRNKTCDGLKDKIYETDRKVNTLEREIRKRIVEHLSIQPSSDLPFCLVLMSVVKDAERLGDYAKNIFEVWELLKKPLDHNLYKKFFDDLDTKLLENFAQTKQAFVESNEQIAEECMKLEREIVKACDGTVEKLAASDLTTNESVCFTLLARYFKRTAAHLTNIASSVILPISNLDFFDEKLRHEKIDKQES